MAPVVKVRVNTFFQENPKPFLDPLSQGFIAAEGLLGLNRIPVLIKGRKNFYLFIFLTCVYSIALTAGLIYLTYEPEIFDNVIVWGSVCVEYTFCVFFSFVSWKRMDRYYNEMNKFDADIGCRPKTTIESLRHLLFTILFTGLVVMFHGCVYIFMIHVPKIWSMPLVLIDLTHCLEVYYYGHLLSILAPRLRLVNYYMESSLSNGALAKRPDIDEFMSFKSKNNQNSEVKKLMDLYHVLIKMYDLLIDAIKWQLLVILITSFVRTLSLCYDFVMRLMHDESCAMDITYSVSLMSMELLPLFSPCIFGDRVHGEVRRLRELIASRLYENKLGKKLVTRMFVLRRGRTQNPWCKEVYYQTKLGQVDKGGRSTARALLALTEARDLSFSLLRMLQIDVSLPFKFIGLLVTYLIILLQFDKVIHPSNPIVMANSTMSSTNSS